MNHLYFQSIFSNSRLSRKSYNENSSGRFVPFSVVKVFVFFFALLILNNGNAQITPTTWNFNANATGWTGNITRTTATTACGSASMRRNLYSFVTTGNMVSPVLPGVNNGGLITLQYKYKAANWSANTVGTNPWGNFNVQYGPTAAGPWTTMATVSQEIQNGSCITKTHTFTPPLGNVFIKWDCFWTAGDYYINFDDVVVSQAAVSACSGIPNAGTASISAASGCSGANITLSSSGLTSGTGISYQWQSGPTATGPWTDITGATTSTLNTSTTATTFYRLVTTCANSGLTNATNAVSYTPTPNTCYVLVNLTDSYGDGWNGATMNFIVNGSVYATFGPAFTTGTLQTLTYCIPSGSSYSLVYTSSGTFPTEVGINMSVSGATVYSVGAGLATVGATLVSGVACPTPCSGTPNAGTSAISVSSGCAGSTFTLSGTGITAGIGVTYQWQSAPSATGPWTNITGATTSTYSTSAATTTFYRLITTCTNSGLSNTSSVVSYGVNSCVGSITLTDSFGDGWNGATMTLNVNGSPFQTFGSTFTTGTSQTINFCLPSASSYSLVYSSSGTYPTEVGVSLTINGVNVYSVAAGGATAGATLSSGIACPPPCSGTPNTPVVSAASTSVCAGETSIISSAGFSAGTGISYQWQSGSSSTGPWTNIGGAISTAYTATAAAGTTFYQLVTTCSNSGLTSTSNAVSIAGQTCYNVPFTGNNTVTACSGILYDHGGSTGDYANNANGYTVLTPSTPGNVIQLSGTMTTEATYDFVRIYDGVGTGGTLLWSNSGTMAIPTITSTTGSLTVQFTSDISLTFSGFQINWTCLPNAPTITGTATTICSGVGATVDLTASGAVGTVYWFQGGCNTTGPIATGTTLTVSPSTTTTYYARNFSVGQWSTCATYTVTVNPTPTNVNAGADVTVQCPGTAVPLSGTVTSIPGTLSVVISGAGFLDEISWTLTNSLGTVIGTGGNYAIGSTNTNPIASSANGPYSLFVETQGTYNDNIVNYSVVCNGSPLISGTLNGGLTVTQVVANCGSNFAYSWTPAASLTNPTTLTPTATPSATETYTFTVTENGCAASDQVTVTVLDNTNPTITAPSSLAVFTDAGSCTATGVSIGSPIVGDNCTVASVNNNAPAIFPVGVTTITWTVTDGFGNTATATQTVTVTDNQNPTISAPSAVNVTADIGSCTATGVALGTPITTDNCSVVSIVNDGPVAYPVGTTTVTWTVTDASGNTATSTQTVTVTDNQNPTITSPANLTVTADPGLCTASGVSLGTPITSDNCGIASVTNNAPATYPNGSTTITWTVTDLYGNTATSTQTVNVTDNEAPIAICQNVFVNLDATGNASVGATQVNSGSSDNCGIATLALSQNSFSCSNVGINTVTLTITDNAGNVSTCPAFVIVQDVLAPIANCQNITVPLDPVTGTVNVLPSQVDNGSSDPCGNASLVLSQTAFDCSDLGPNTVTLTVTDVNGNVSTCTAVITVVDNSIPTFVTTPSNITVNSIVGLCGRVVSYPIPTFTDACSANLAQTDGTGLTSGDLFPVGSTTQTFTLTDQSGNTVSYSFTVTVVDNQLPVITNCPTNISVSTSPSNCSAIVNWVEPTGSDNCPGVILSSSHASGSTFSVGTTTVTYTATDASGNTSNCSFTVTVTDNSAPVVTSLPTVSGSCSVTVTPPTVQDNCSGTITGTTTSPLTYLNQGTYTIPWTFTDANGNSVTVNQTVVVQDVTPPFVTAPVPVIATANASCIATGVTLIPPTATDNCGTATLTNNAPATYPIGSTIVTWTATDAVGNTSIASQIVTVVDNALPTITAPANVTSVITSGCSVTGIALGTPVAIDNCTVTSVTNNAPATFPVGTTTVTWSAIDGSGNVGTATQTVTVLDNITPTITAPAAVTVNANGTCSAFNVNLGVPTTADNCSVASVTNNAPSVFTLGNTTVTWTVTDASGNSSTATQLVTVIDNTNPTIIAPATVTAFTNSGCTATGVTLGTPIANDNCSTVTVANNAPAAFPLGTTVVVWTATDGAGNTSTASQNVIVIDQTNPTITAPAGVTATANASCTATSVVLGSPVVNDNCGVQSVTNNAPAIFPIGLTIVTWTVTDNSGNTATAAQTVNVTDNINPTITAPAVVTVNANSTCSAFNVNLGLPVTADNCSVVSVTNNAPAVFGLGSTTVTWTVTDASGNTATAIQVVNVIDNTAPAITAPIAINTVTNAGCFATGVVLGSPITSDNCSAVIVTNDAPSSFPLGTTTVTWTATDAVGNSSTATQTVVVTDQIMPSITAPTNISVNAGNSCNVTGVALGFPVTSDNCGVANVSNDAPTTFPIGVTTITWTIIDNSGNTATSTQTVTVVDNTAPTITAPSGVTVDANSSCVAFNVNLGSPAVADNCGGTTVTNDAPSVFELGSTLVTWTVTDASGNTSTATQTVVVEDNTAPDLVAPASLTVNVNDNCSASGIDLGSPVASDNCSTVNIQNNAPASFPVGVTNITWTATDANGNSTTSTQTVTVVDNINPTVVVQDITVTLDGTGSASITFADIDAGSTDNCGIASAVISQSDFACEDIGTNVLAVTVVDNNGNVSFSTVEVTVQSNGVDTDLDGIDDACDSDANTVVADIPEAFTPNGNNINDYFEVKNLTNFDERKLEVFNRYGLSVYSNDQYDNTWDGTRSDNGKELPDGTYYYVLTLNGEIKKGFVYINRVKQ